MSLKCPLCGGEFASIEQCRERFDLCMALEYQNPSAYGAVHHLSVVCYMLQHNAYSDEVWLGFRHKSLLIKNALHPRNPEVNGRFLF
jgi:hypothetical protein